MPNYLHRPGGLTANGRYRVDTGASNGTAATITRVDPATTIDGSYINTDSNGQAGAFLGTAATLYLRPVDNQGLNPGTAVTSTGSAYPVAETDRTGLLNGTTLEIPFRIADATGITATSATNQFFSTVFDKGQFLTGTPIYFRCALNQANSGTFAVNVRLYNLTTSATVASSTLTASLAQFGRSIQISADISAGLSAGAAEYSIEAWVANGGSGNLYCPQIIARPSVAKAG